MEKCWVCDADGVPFSNKGVVSNADAVILECEACGTYEVAGVLKVPAAKVFQTLSPDQRRRLSYAIRRANDEGRRSLRLDVKNYEAVIASAPRLDALDQTEAFIAAIQDACPHYGAGTPEEISNRWAARLMLPLPAFIALLKELGGLIENRTKNGPRMSFGLTLKGWERAREIRQRRGSGRQAFVAMWFHPAMQDAYLKGFAPALEDNGYTPYRVDFAHHNNKIDDEIMAQIRRSRLVVADATGNRSSVYYEAGFAQGLGIPVLWCCNSSKQSYVVDVDPQQDAPPTPRQTDWFKIRAFDTEHHNFIAWADEADLKRKLSARIEGLGLALPAPPAP